MGVNRRKILIIGLFADERNTKKINRSAADQLAELFKKNGYDLVTVSSKVNRAGRLMETLLHIFIKRSHYDIAIVPLYGTFFSYRWAYLSVLLLKRLGKKIVIIVHGGSIPARMKTNATKFLRLIHKADEVVCPSPYMAGVMESYGVQALLVENVITLEEYRFQVKETFRPRLLWMRTLHDIYNPEMAVKVTALLKKKYSNIKTVIAGRDDGSKKSVTTLAKKLGVDNNIVLPGYLSQQQKNEYAAQCDIYICTNRIDNAPVSFVEMMSLGLPVVSVNVGGIPYLVKDGENGLLVNEGDEEAMAEKIETIIQNAALGKKLAHNGRAFSRQFGEAPVLQKWEKLLAGLGHRIN